MNTTSPKPAAASFAQSMMISRLVGICSISVLHGMQEQKVIECTFAAGMKLGR